MAQRTRKIERLELGEAILFAPRRFTDNRGWFSETYNARREAERGVNAVFVQDNVSLSTAVGTIRGIHFQRPPHAQSKLVRCPRGRLLDFAVDLRAGSPTFGKYVSAELSAQNGKQLFIPAGFGHAFITLEPDTEIAYKVDDYYSPECDGGIRWDCPDIGIDWPVVGSPKVSVKDADLPCLKDFESPFPYDGTPMSLRDEGGA